MLKIWLTLLIIILLSDICDIGDSNSSVNNDIILIKHIKITNVINIVLESIVLVTSSGRRGLEESYNCSISLVDTI